MKTETEPRGKYALVKLAEARILLAAAQSAMARGTWVEENIDARINEFFQPEPIWIDSTENRERV
jgi:hypothetical protein